MKQNIKGMVSGIVIGAGCALLNVFIFKEIDKLLLKRKAEKA